MQASKKAQRKLKTQNSMKAQRKLASLKAKLDGNSVQWVAGVKFRATMKHFFDTYPCTGRRFLHLLNFKNSWDHGTWFSCWKTILIWLWKNLLSYLIHQHYVSVLMIVFFQNDRLSFVNYNCTLIWVRPFSFKYFVSLQKYVILLKAPPLSSCWETS